MVRPRRRARLVRRPDPQACDRRVRERRRADAAPRGRGRLARGAPRPDADGLHPCPPTAGMAAGIRQPSNAPRTGRGAQMRDGLSPERSARGLPRGKWNCRGGHPIRRRRRSAAAHLDPRRRAPSVVDYLDWCLPQSLRAARGRAERARCPDDCRRRSRDRDIDAVPPVSDHPRFSTRLTSNSRLLTLRRA